MALELSAAWAAEVLYTVREVAILSRGVRFQKAKEDLSDGVLPAVTPLH